MADNMEVIDLFGESKHIKKVISRECLSDNLYQLLNNLDLMNFIKCFTNEFKELIEYIKLQQGENTCQNLSLLFNPHRLSTKSKKSKKSVFEAIKDKNFVSGLSRAILFDNRYDKNKDYLFNSFRLGINGVQYINEFQPYIARNIYKKYHLDANSKILDPCAGWGGRMIGASVVSNYYECFEPSTKTFEGLNRLSNFIQLINSDFKTVINKIPFEDSNLVDNSFDFALTSPPYYDTEIYSDEVTNSLNRYNTFDKWTDCFYLPLINKTMVALKTRKTFVINIGSRNYPLSRILISNFKDKYEIKKLGNFLSGNGGLSKQGEGEMFYSIVK